MKNRVFTPEFKLSIVQGLVNGEKTVIQLYREHNLSNSLIHNWKKINSSGRTATPLNCKSSLLSSRRATFKSRMNSAAKRSTGFLEFY